MPTSPKHRVCPCGQAFVVRAQYPNQHYCTPKCRHRYMKAAEYARRKANGTYQPAIRSAREDFERYAKRAVDPVVREFCLQCAREAE